MATVDLTDETFSQEIDSKGMAIIDVWAEWCVPCKKFAPIFESVSEEFPEILFAKIDAGENPNLLQGLRVQAIPTVLAVKDSYFVYSQRGVHTESGLRELAQKLSDIPHIEIQNYAIREETLTK